MCLASKIFNRDTQFVVLKNLSEDVIILSMPNAADAGIVAVLLFVCRRRNIYICIYIFIGCRAILYSLLLRTAPSHLQLLYECVCCRKIVICVCDREKKCASAFTHVDDADGAKEKKKNLYFSLFFIAHCP